MPTWTNICRQCRTRFTAHRLSSRYCGATCRQQAHRARIHEERVKEILASIEEKELPGEDRVNEILASIEAKEFPKAGPTKITIDAAALIDMLSRTHHLGQTDDR